MRATFSRGPHVSPRPEFATQGLLQEHASEAAGPVAMPHGVFCIQRYFDIPTSMYVMSWELLTHVTLLPI